MSKRDWLTLFGFLFIVFASTISVFDASQIMRYAKYEPVTLFEWLRLYFLSHIECVPQWFWLKGG